MASVLGLLSGSAKLTEFDERIVAIAIEHGVPQLFVAVYEQCFYVDWSGSVGSQILNIMSLASLPFSNMTAVSAGMRDKVLELELAGVILNYLKRSKLDPGNLTESGIQYCVQPLIRLLHNVVQVSIFSN